MIKPRCKVLITGHSGYIGTDIAREIHDFGCQVDGLGRKLDHLSPDITYQHIEDIRTVTAKQLQGYDTIIHLASIPNDPLDRFQIITDDVNVHGTMHLAREAKKAGVNDFFFASSCSVYGKSDLIRPITETDPINPLTEYARSKAQAEKELQAIVDPDFHVTIMRLPTVYGYSSHPRLDLIVNEMTADAYFTQKINIQGDGNDWRALIHVKDLARSVREMYSYKSKVRGKTFNVGFMGENYQTKTIAETIKRQLPITDIIYNPQKTDDRSYRVDFSKFQNTFPTLNNNWTVHFGVNELLTELRNGTINEQQYSRKLYRRLDTLVSENIAVTTNTIPYLFPIIS